MAAASAAASVARQSATKQRLHFFAFATSAKIFSNGTMIGEKKDDDDAGSGAPVKVLDKSAVLQEVRAFNDPQIDARRCVELIGSLLRLISRGDVLTANECQDVFFGSTKLFQCPDERLRRMVYLLIKELRPSADIVFIVTASLNKDMTGSNDNFRSNALRVMCQITDAQMLLQVERFIKQACVDKVAAVSSAALVSGLQLLKKNNDSVKRWQNEVTIYLACVCCVACSSCPRSAMLALSVHPFQPLFFTLKSPRTLR